MNLVKTAIAGIGLALAMSTSQAGTVFLDPVSQTFVQGDVGAGITVDLKIDFADLLPDGSVGGGVNIAVGAPASFVSFAPSAYFNSLDPFFSGFGTANADAGTDFEVHFGNFPSLPGLDTIQTLGTFTVDLDTANVATANLDLSVNTFWGFPSVTQGLATLENATLDVTAVPIPAAVWLFGSGLLGLVGVARRKKQHA